MEAQRLKEEAQRVEMIEEQKGNRRASHRSGSGSGSGSSLRDATPLCWAPTQPRLVVAVVVEVEEVLLRRRRRPPGLRQLRLTSRARRR